VLAGFALRRHDLLLLDEPTNHLDAVTVGVLADALAAFDGTVVVATHDRFLVERVATHVGMVGDGDIELHEGVRPQFFEPTRLRNAGTARPAAASAAAAHTERKRKKGERGRAQRRVEAIQAELEACDARIELLDQDMVSSATDFPRVRQLSEQRQREEAQSAALYDEWERLEEQLAT
jgi:ATPase subunit of ABC transporter with duplicated ATPase domains